MRIFIIFVLLLVSSSSFAADAKDSLTLGIDAYNKQHFQEALEIFKPLAEAGNPIAQNYMGKCYMSSGTTQNLIEGAKWFKKSASQGNASAQFALGSALFYGYGLQKDEKEASLWFLKAAEQGHATAQFSLGFMYANSFYFKKDILKAVAWYQKAMQNGSLDAQYNLGRMYAQGQEIPLDKDKGKQLIKAAAAQGYKLAQGFLNNEIGLTYALGDGVAQDDKKAKEWFLQSADQGNLNAIHNLGVITNKKDPVEAFKYFKKAAEMGLDISQDQLGFQYFKGIGIVQDFKEAAKWFFKAAEQGHAASQFMLGFMHANGFYFEKSPLKAVEWYQKATQKGYPNAQYKLGRMYLSGKVIPANMDEGEKLIRAAAAQGYQLAKDFLEKNKDCFQNSEPIPSESTEILEYTDDIDRKMELK